MFLYSGKYNPEFYLNPQFRLGVSTLANLLSDDECKKGVERLKQDIESKKIYEIIKSYKHNKADYLFVTATK